MPPGVVQRPDPTVKEDPMATIELGKYLEGRAESFHACLEACVEALVACEACAEACLGEERVKMMTECIRLCRDCSEACVSCVIILSRGSEQAAAFCSACAEICELCAEECESHDHPHCQRCAEACRLCAEECWKLAAA